ncbi:hypothetical protein [Streptomyces flaveus]|uniref:hypothetical protein n=1 Tax=Streptomyces flaveus TaxID=66370 RepID=UPI0033222A7A
MPSVLGLLEAREKKVREEVARLREEAERVRAALAEAESRLARLADARVTVAEVLAEPPSVAAEPARSAVAGSVVPRRAEGMAVSVLPLDYQRIMSVVATVGDQGVPAPAGGLCSVGPSRGRRQLQWA